MQIIDGLVVDEPLVRSGKRHYRKTRYVPIPAYHRLWDAAAREAESHVFALSEGVTARLGRAASPIGLADMADQLDALFGV